MFTAIRLILEPGLVLLYFRVWDLSQPIIGQDNRSHLKKDSKLMYIFAKISHIVAQTNHTGVLLTAGLPEHLSFTVYYLLLSIIIYYLLYTIINFLLLSTIYYNLLSTIIYYQLSSTIWSSYHHLANGMFLFLFILPWE